MFFARVAQPRFDAHGNILFSRKIGMFPLTEKVLANRSSKNRCAATLLTRPAHGLHYERYLQSIYEEYET